MLQVVEAPQREINRKVPQVLEMVGLPHKAKAMPGNFQVGEQQRVALARAIVNNPDALVADEPTGNLDPDTSWEIMKLLSDINKRGTTIIVATHARELVDSMKKRVIQLDKGYIVRDEARGAYRK